MLSCVTFCPKSKNSENARSWRASAAFHNYQGQLNRENFAWDKMKKPQKISHTEKEKDILTKLVFDAQITLSESYIDLMWTNQLWLVFSIKKKKRKHEETKKERGPLAFQYNKDMKYLFDIISNIYLVNYSDFQRVEKGEIFEYFDMISELLVLSIVHFIRKEKFRGIAVDGILEFITLNIIYFQNCFLNVCSGLIFKTNFYGSNGWM